MLGGNRRNVVFRVSIVINIAVLLYAAVHLSGNGVGEEWPVVSPEALERAGTAGASAPEYRFERNDTAAPPPASSVRNLDETTSQKTPTTMASPNKTASSTVSLVELEKRLSSGFPAESDAPIDLDQVDEDALSLATLLRLRALLACNDREFARLTYQRGAFWVIQNYVSAEHGSVGCHETITYTTHAGYEFLDNVQPLVERWMAPISLAIHAPGSDLAATVSSIRYLRDCLGTDLVRQFVSFHIFFSHKHIPPKIPDPDVFLAEPYNCTLKAPYDNVQSNATYIKKQNMLYPVNVARNVARDAALSHFVLVSDIELYPSPNLVPRFLNMIARNAPPLSTSTRPKIFPISIFEVDGKHMAPTTKTQLKAMLAAKTAIPFHKFVCPNCHNIPQGQQWMNANETNQMDVFHVGKRRGKFVHWEPIFIGTHYDPYYDERLSWDGKQDKMPHGYVLCVMDYDFMILNNAFLCHKPGIKHYVKNAKRDVIARRQSKFIKSEIMPELKKLYGTRNGCAL